MEDAEEVYVRSEERIGLGLFLIGYNFIVLSLREDFIEGGYDYIDDEPK